MEEVGGMLLQSKASEELGKNGATLQREQDSAR
jgi:hypothetical protein